MTSKKLFYHSLVFLFMLSTPVSISHAGYIQPIEIFTTSGNYHDSPGLNFYVEVSSPRPQQVDFTFYNKSSIASCVSQIYFDSDSILSFAGITNGPGTSFVQGEGPKNLPAGQTLTPPFETSTGLSFGDVSPTSKNGINPGEWLRINLTLNNGVLFEQVVDKLNTASIRIGTHVIALPDGSSESGVNVPEPLTFCLMATGTLAFLKRHSSKLRRAKNNSLRQLARFERKNSQGPSAPHKTNYAVDKTILRMRPAQAK